VRRSLKHLNLKLCVTPPPRFGWGALVSCACHEHPLEVCDEFWRCVILVTVHRSYKNRLTKDNGLPITTFACNFSKCNGHPAYLRVKTSSIIALGMQNTCIKLLCFGCATRFHAIHTPIHTHKHRLFLPSQTFAEISAKVPSRTPVQPSSAPASSKPPQLAPQTPHTLPTTAISHLRRWRPSRTRWGPS